ncbi:MAG: tRNA (N6-isopentenyl adenosine(37)-C2)-methylthiotransferase MiaB [Candidatus Marinimicrobia bacterium]|nr:tRNA (N6-isopentenyl adenosine(37)-C2)-methylthiotransferase MiaB [Candidatus Neomarinimicrobiota bacterium]
MKTYYIETYGCQMNVYDSEIIAALLQEKGLEEVTSPEKADVVLLNTCSVRELAEQKIHTRLGQLRIIQETTNPTMIMGVVGCMAQNLKKSLLQKKPYITFILGPDSYRNIPKILTSNRTSSRVIDTHLSSMELYDGLFPARHEGINAWISISRGCDKFCTYCIVPYTRGRERSRSSESILQEAKRAIDKGFVEITLLGQNVNSYRSSSGGFSELLLQLAQLSGLKRLRYTSPHPQDMNDDVIAVHKDYYPVVCDHIHLPLQSGSNSILKAMNRTYTWEHYLSLVEKIRSAVPTMSITTDMIVGFPGETEKDYEDTLDMMEKVRFDAAFMFKYSPRPGTKAAILVDTVPEDVKSVRLNRMIRLQNKHTLEKNQALIGKKVEILVEKESTKNPYEMMGRTSTNKIVIFPALKVKPKDLITRTITDAQGVTLFSKP